MMQELLAALAVLFLAVLACAVVIHRQHRQLANMQAALQHLKEDQGTQLQNLGRRLDNYLSGSMRMGKELHELRELAAPLPEKLMQIEQRDPGSLSFSEAARLVGLGASSEDLQHACGLSQSEAELLQRIHGSRKSQ